jgi:hypothetical protein
MLIGFDMIFLWGYHGYHGGDVSKRREGRRQVGGECWGSRLLRYWLLSLPMLCLKPPSSSRSLAKCEWAVNTRPPSSSRSLAIKLSSYPSRSMHRSSRCTGRVASASITWYQAMCRTPPAAYTLIPSPSPPPPTSQVRREKRSNVR